MRAALLAILVIGCRPKPAPPPPGVDSVAAQPLPRVYAGVVVDGVFEDRGGSFSIAVPEGWSARPGLDAEPLRLTLHHAATGTRVRVWRHRGESLRPTPRDGCVWVFQDAGPYRALRVPGPVGAATCMPGEPDDPRAFAWVHPTGGETWTVEVLPPSPRLLVGLDEGERVVGTARWRPAP